MKRATSILAVTLSLAFGAAEAEEYRVPKDPPRDEQRREEPRRDRSRSSETRREPERAPARERDCRSVTRRVRTGTRTRCITTDLNDDGRPERSCFDVPVFESVTETVCR